MLSLTAKVIIGAVLGVTGTIAFHVGLLGWVWKGLQGEVLSLRLDLGQGEVSKISSEATGKDTDKMTKVSDDKC